MVNLTVDQVRKMIPTNSEPEIWHSFCMEYFEKYEINTPNRIAGFFAQGAHESSDFKVLIENLNYSADRLMAVFGRRYFPSLAVANQYHRNPTKIANHVYDDANRSSKLGNTKPGDGWRFRGRGIFQLTGRFNYDSFAKSVGMTAEEASAYLGTKRGAFESACWFWKSRNLNKFADTDSITAMSKAVNGGDNGLTDRINKYNRNKKVMETSEKAPDNKPIAVRMLSKGSKGDDVRKVQSKLGFSGRDLDGIYGNMTQNAVRSWQRSNKQTVTGSLTVKQIEMLLA